MPFSFSTLTTTWKLILGAIVLLLAVWAFFFVRGLFVGGKDVEARLGSTQTDAALRSGQDAVNTVGDASKRETETDAATKGTQDEVNKATDGAGVDRVARNGLCASAGLCE